MKCRLNKILLISFVAILGLARVAPAQVTGSNDSIPLADALSRIGGHYHTHILFKQEWVQGLRTVMPPYFYGLGQDLNYVLDNRPFSYYNYHNQYIILYRNNNAGMMRSRGRNISAVYSKILYRLEGKVLSEKEETPVIGATVFINELDTGTITNINGFFHFTLPEGNYTLTIKSVGFVEQTENVDLSDNKSVKYYLPNEVLQLNEVVISGRAEENVNESAMGVSKLNVKNLRVQPNFMGEADIVKSLLMLPGVTTVGEAASGFNVRGGSADQNLVIMDGAPLFNSSHVFGLFSTFNEDLVDNVTLIRSGIPPRYGDRLSSVLDVNTKTRQVNRFSGNGGIGLFSSHLALSIPVIKDKLSILTGGRILYSDYLLHLLKNSEISHSSAFFYDGNIKVNYRIKKGSQLFYSFYKSYDKFKLPSDTLYSWGTENHSVTYNQLIGKKLVVNAIGVLAKYNYGLSESMPKVAFNWNAGIYDKNLKLEFFYIPGESHKIDFGGSMAWYTFIPGSLTSGPKSIINPFLQEDLYARESYIYASDEFDLFKFLRIMAGLRVADFSQVGPGTIHLYEPGIPRSLDTQTGSKTYGQGKKINDNYGIEPRLSFRFLLNSENSIKLSYNRLYQYIQQISNTTAITPIDLWFPSGAYLKPQRCDQVSLGFFKNFHVDKFETSAEIYYKWLDNVIDYKNGAELFLNPNVETELLQGKGKAYGLELSARKNIGRVTGWASYSYSRSLRKIAGPTPDETINGGNFYPSNYDMPNDFKFTLIYQINRRWNVAWNYVFSTGRPTTYPMSKYEVDKITIANYGNRNLERLPDYHRLDFSVTMKGNNRKNKLWDANWSFTVYNVYFRQNAYSVYFKPIPGSRIPQAYKYTILGTIIPSLAYNFRFL